MKIGIDLDGVVFDSEKHLRVYSEIYDMLELNQNSKKDNKELEFQDRFDWTEEQIKDFWEKYIKKIWRESNYMPGAKTVLKMLKEDGHELIVITARGGTYKEAIQATEDRLKEDGLDIFDKYYWATNDKSDICKKENIELMIEDNDVNCKHISDCRIKTIYLKDAPSKELEENEYLKILYNWGEIYRYIKELDNKI